MTAIWLLGAPVVLAGVAGILGEWLRPGPLFYLMLLFLFAVLLVLLWNGGRYARDLLRGGDEVLRIGVDGLYWRDFGPPLAWEDIARVQFEVGGGEQAWYWLTLMDGRRFKLDASALSVGTQQISWLFANYLPATKLEGI